MERTAFNVEFRTEGGAITHQKRLMLEGVDPQAEAQAWADALGEGIVVTKVEAA